MKKRRLIKEYADNADKCSKRIELTAKGEKVVEITWLILLKTQKMLMKDLADDNKELCIQLLKHTEIKLSAICQKHNGKEFDDIYQELVADTKAKDAEDGQRNGR